MKLLYKEHPRTLVLYSDTFSLSFRIKSSKELDSKKPTVNVDLIPNTNITKEQGYRTLIRRDVFGCLGLIYVEDQIYLAIITGALTNVARPIENETVDKIYSVDFVSLNNDDWDFVELDSSGYPIVVNEEQDDDDNNITSDRYARVQHPCFELRKLLSNGSFYYSNDFDLTSLLQNRGVSSPDTRINSIDHYKPEYMWNSFLMDELIHFRSNLDTYNQLILDDNRFLTTVIRGFAKTTPIGSHGDSLTIISKQSWKRAGTRYNTRGIDDNGNVANFVETEYIYYNPSKSSIFTFTQVRGSVPTFWEQDSSLMNPKITLTRSTQATQPVFNKHFGDILQSYGVCHIVDLLSKTKSSEVQISQRYQQLYNHCDKKEEIDYTAFDFHHETKIAGGFAGATKILPYLQDSLNLFGWFTYDMNRQEVITRQDGIFRVNCLDCLDRTNLIEQVICRSVLENILTNQGIYNNRMAFEGMIQKHNTLWADNGDAISQIYTGTNALKSSFSRSGKMNFAGALSDVTKSVSRMYQNTFVDGKKQLTIDILVGVDGRNSRKVKVYNPASEYIKSKLKEQENSFTSFENVKIFTGTYNVNAFNPLMTKNIDLTSWLFPSSVQNGDGSLPDMYAIGLQELIELNASSILNADGSRALQWSQLLNEQLNSFQMDEEYVLLRTESIATMALFLYVKKSKVSYVTRVAGSSKKTGLGGMAANKGACGIRCLFGTTSFAFVTCHLAAGTLAVTERYNDYSTIMQGLVFPRNYYIKDHDHVIWFGDLNYRIDIPNLECRQLVANGAYKELLENDQLTRERRDRGAFNEFKEGLVKFPPTYKFDKYTNDYDTSEKQRTPSWTDRVLFLSDKKLTTTNPLKLLKYDSAIDVLYSDHKAVYASFETTAKIINEQIKKNKLNEIILSLSFKKITPSPSPSPAPLTTSSTTTTTTTMSRTSSLTRSSTSILTPTPVSAGGTTDLIHGLGQTTTTTTLSLAPPPPPPARRAMTTPSTIPPIGFSSTPLIPSPLSSNRSSPAPSINASSEKKHDTKPPIPPMKRNTTLNDIKLSSSSSPTNSIKSGKVSKDDSDVDTMKKLDVKPMIPKKPENLKSIHKDGKLDNNGNSTSQNTNGGESGGGGVATPKSMASWQPLVPGRK